MSLTDQEIKLVRERIEDYRPTLRGDAVGVFLSLFDKGRQFHKSDVYDTCESLVKKGLLLHREYPTRNGIHRVRYYWTAELMKFAEVLQSVDEL